MKKYILKITLLCLVCSCSSFDPEAFEQAVQNGIKANEGFERCLRFVNGWLAEADSVSGLIPRNLTSSRDIWNACDAAADNYPFMALTAAILGNKSLNSRMLSILEAERKLTSRIGRLPDTYSFPKQGFLYEQPNLKEIVFGSAEYMKDGLVPVTEFLGKSPWSERLLEILDDLDTELHLTPELIHETFGYIQAVETSGDMLQVLSRAYRMTGDRRYLERAIRFGDYYLNDRRLPTLVTEEQGLRLRDHGCEIVSGLTELYAAIYMEDADKRAEYQPFIHKMIDAVLAKGRNEDGLFYNAINHVTGEITSDGIADTWGYTYDAIYTVYLLDGTEEYREAVLKALRGVTKYRKFNWEHGSADGYADAIEGALNLYFFEPLPETTEWIDSEILNMWDIQKPSGIIEGWHGDGNFARTTLMYCLWKTGGVTIDDWDNNLIYGALVKDGKIFLTLSSPTERTVRLHFEPELHRSNLNMPVNYPRINQFQEWFPVDSNKTYRITNAKTGKSVRVTGSQLLDEYEVTINANEALCITVRQL
ncbi:MAG: hypothetical protein LBR84_07245 [Tannerella sp.]|jgi:hypothetical protein|nr:hypothetical protein [Tannerella sp.]